MGATAPAAEAELVSPPAEARFLADTFAISLDEAASRIDLQDDIGVLGADAQHQWPETFGGLWIDHRAGGKVFVAFASDAGARVEALRGRFARPDLLQPVDVAKSRRELEARQLQMVAEREEARAGRLTFPGVTGARYQIDIDVRRNTLIVGVEDARQATVAAFQARYGDDVLVEQMRAPELDACTRTDCRYTLRSGLKTNSCTLAFTANARTRVLTAGHCSDGNQTHGTEVYGMSEASIFAGRVDAQKNTVTNGFGASASVYVGSATVARKVTSVGLWANLAVGTVVCKSGVTTEETCDQVESTDFAWSEVPSGNRFIKTLYCALGGDSGSGVYIGNQAVGIHSGGASGPCEQEGDYSVFGHIEYARSALGVTIDTSDPTPSYQSVSGARHGVSTLTLQFSRHMLCSSVNWWDFSVSSSVVGVGLQNHSVTSASCELNRDSYSRVTLTISPTPIATTTLSVSLIGSVTDVVGTAAPGATRTTTVAT